MSVTTDQQQSEIRRFCRFAKAVGRVSAENRQLSCHKAQPLGSHVSAWIKMLGDDVAGPELKEVLELARTPHGTVDNVMRVHSLRPHTMRGHIVLYRAALHNDNNTLPTWLQETIASYVSVLNKCPYSYANHWANARHLIDNEQRSSAIEALINSGSLSKAGDLLTAGELAMLEYAGKLTVSPGDMVEQDVEKLRQAGFNDGEILEANQVIGYFNYANRLLNGLGVSTDGDIVGFYSDSDSDAEGIEKGSSGQSSPAS